MTVKDFLRDRFLMMLLHLVCMCLLTVFLRLTGYGMAAAVLILIFWGLILTVWMCAAYVQRRGYFREVEEILEKVDQRYLLGELLPDSVRLEDRLYREIICRSNKSVIERIRQIEETQKEYKEYIESWVHEVKSPITSISLICANGQKKRSERRTSAEVKEAFQTIGLENQRLENYVDMVLYYARSEQVWKDYLIQETDLEGIVYEALEKNKLLMIQNQVRAEVNVKERAYTDRKWIGFILNQMFLNSVKYKGNQPVFHIYTERKKEGVLLILEDNGVGILPEELSRIFEKGFTGSNGRNYGRSTGMGLYLCRKLCDKLGIGLRAESEYGGGTRMILEFPISNYISRNQRAQNLK